MLKLFKWFNTLSKITTNWTRFSPNLSHFWSDLSHFKPDLSGCWSDSQNFSWKITQLKIDLKSDLKSHLAGTKSDLAKYDFKSYLFLTVNKVRAVQNYSDYLFKKKNLKAAFLSLFFEKKLNLEFLLISNIL